MMCWLFFAGYKESFLDFAGFSTCRVLGDDGIWTSRGEWVTGDAVDKVQGGVMRRQFFLSVSLVRFNEPLFVLVFEVHLIYP